MQTVKVVYLHVLATNTPAIKFYEKHSFVQHLYLPFYYHIAGSCCDARSYALYINGGKPPQTNTSQLRGRLRRLFRIAFRLCYCRFAALRIAASIRSPVQ
ncbi:NAA60 [Bugula neritina]|uniref:histone acetyltransferase n=1 Tax=Bugula neritina TaxID=10212 RepID=A0A7J7K3Q3_BUGNE|nr:NAA60 [Bugula neritina]